MGIVSTNKNKQGFKFQVKINNLIGLENKSSNKENGNVYY